MLSIDWKFWRSYLQKSFDQCITIHMLGRLAALRELLKTNLSDYFFSEFNSQDQKKDCLMHHNETSNHTDIVRMDDQLDEFFDFDDESECNYTFTLPEDQTGNLAHSWSSPEPSLFQIRGETFLQDRKKITADSTLLQTVAVDWLKSDKREDHLATLPRNIVQKYAADGRPKFFIIINFQHATGTPIKDIPLLDNFVKGDDAFRNSRFKLIPHVSKITLEATHHGPVTNSSVIYRYLSNSYFRSIFWETGFWETGCYMLHPKQTLSIL